MLNKIKNFLSSKVSSNVYTLVEIDLTHKDSNGYRILKFYRNNRDVFIKERISANSIEDLENKIEKKVPIIINFKGKGIINKRIEGNFNFMNEFAFDTDIEDFYVYSFKQSRYNFISICRKEVINEYFDLFKSKKYNVLDYSIGPFVAILAKNFVSDTSILVDGYEFLFSGSELKDYVINKKCKDYNGLTSSDLVSFTTLLNFVVPSQDISYDKRYLKYSIENYKYQKFFNYTLISGLLFFLITLVLSNFLANQFNKRYIKAQERVFHFKDNYELIKKMQNDIADSKLIVGKLGVYDTNFLSFYMQEVANSVVEGIEFKELNINPIGKIKEKAAPKVAFKVILVKGVVVSNERFNTWLQKLKEYGWVSRVEILDLYENKETKNNFLIKLIIK